MRDDNDLNIDELDEILGQLPDSGEGTPLALQDGGWAEPHDALLGDEEVRALYDPPPPQEPPPPPYPLSPFFGNESAAPEIPCARCPMAVWTEDKYGRVAAYCRTFHRELFSSEEKDGINTVKRCDTQIAAELEYQANPQPDLDTKPTDLLKPKNKP